jgi:Domain of unknown function (DUF4440)
MKNAVLILSTFFLMSDKLLAQKPTQNAPLFREIFEMDSLLFEAFNNCDTIKFRSFLTEDNEFYHDKGGFADLESTMKGFKNNCEDDQESARRVLLTATMEVFPIPNFGAMQLGSHQFFITPKGEKEVTGGTFRFLQVWKKTNNGWKVARIMSFDHQ